MSWDERRAVAGAVSVVAAVVVAVVSSTVFRYHSSNHDEGVYLQHAEMLLSGRLRMRTGELTEAFRPWFFVVDGATVYPKYTPVTGAVFAAGEALYSYRAALVVLAAINAALIYAVSAEVFDRRVGALASAAALFSPLFVVQSSMFLSYAPTTAFNLGFALAYLRAWRCGSHRYAAAAGFCAGIAFFSRPYTAVVFAAPFVVHAAYTVASERSRERITLYATTAALGLALVGVTLAYNRIMTGDPLVFPYLEFAPNDGVGFGEREINGYSRNYTPELALRANLRVMRRFVTDWGPGGVVGAALTAVGAADALRDRSEAKLLVVGVGVAVVVGNVPFWGNLNVLGEMVDPQDGLIHLYGTLYHFDLILPACALSAAGVVAVFERLETRLDRRRAVTVAVAVAVVFAGVGLGNTATKAEENLVLTESYAEAYEPFEEESYEGVVFLPTPYGNWLNHPFQYLRNDPDLNGTTVYATDRGGDNFEVVETYPERDLYRYAYRGVWAPYEGEKVDPIVERLRVVEGGDIGVKTTLDIPDEASSVTATLRGAPETTYTTVESDAGSARINWEINSTVARLSDGNVSVSLSRSGEVVLEVTVTQRYDSFTYRQELGYDAGGEGVRVLSPPYTEKCYTFDRCGGEATVVDGAVTTEVSSTTPE